MAAIPVFSEEWRVWRGYGVAYSIAAMGRSNSSNSSNNQLFIFTRKLKTFVANFP
jgi:hypothetical protein